MFVLKVMDSTSQPPSKEENEMWRIECTERNIKTIVFFTKVFNRLR